MPMLAVGVRQFLRPPPKTDSTAPVTMAQPVFKREKLGMPAHHQRRPCRPEHDFAVEPVETLSRCPDITLPTVTPLPEAALSERLAHQEHRRLAPFIQSPARRHSGIAYLASRARSGQEWSNCQVRAAPRPQAERLSIFGPTELGRHFAGKRFRITGGDHGTPPIEAIVAERSSAPQ